MSLRKMLFGPSREERELAAAVKIMVSVLDMSASVVKAVAEVEAARARALNPEPPKSEGEL